MNCTFFPTTFLPYFDVKVLKLNSILEAVEQQWKLYHWLSGSDAFTKIQTVTGSGLAGNQ